MSYSVIIPAAGSGSRMGASVPKVLLKLGTSASGQPISIVRRTVEAFLSRPRCERVLVCVPPAWRTQYQDDLRGLERVALVDGGATRQESVGNGLAHLVTVDRVNDDSVVLVHDAARCCISAEVIDRVVVAVEQYGAATSAVKVVDSVCRAPEGVLSEGVERAHLWALHTPQGFLLKDLVRGHEQGRKNGVEALHDAQLVMSFREVWMVEGDRFNIKVTEPSDLAVAEAVLKARIEMLAAPLLEMNS
jgi:2-C-methyl-D-erythritol 4-phosphate cytidylyltransferase